MILPSATSVGSRWSTSRNTRPMMPCRRRCLLREGQTAWSDGAVCHRQPPFAFRRAPPRGPSATFATTRSDALNRKVPHQVIFRSSADLVVCYAPTGGGMTQVNEACRSCHHSLIADCSLAWRHACTRPYGPPRQRPGRCRPVVGLGELVEPECQCLDPDDGDGEVGLMDSSVNTMMHGSGGSSGSPTSTASTAVSFVTNTKRPSVPGAWPREATR
jgi:hypothetical protein